MILVPTNPISFQIFMVPDLALAITQNRSQSASDILLNSQYNSCAMAMNPVFPLSTHILMAQGTHMPPIYADNSNPYALRNYLWI